MHSPFATAGDAGRESGASSVGPIDGQAFVYRPEAVDDLAEQPRRDLGVIGGRMREAIIPLKPRGDDGAPQHRLPVSDSGQGRGIETRERVKGVRLILLRSAPA